MTTLGLVVHPTRPAAQAAATQLREIADVLGLGTADATAGEPCDLVVAIGGDGTTLRAAGLAAAWGIPVMGINVGRLGFLSSANAEGLDDALKAIDRGEYALEARMLLEAVSGGKDVDPTPAVALNDVALEKTTPARVIEVDLAVGDEEVARYTADGFIVATPTGSTAYSLSAGGPVVEPSQRVMVLTPVSAHSPLWRSLVVGTDRAVTLTLAQGTAMLTVDGRPLARLTPPSTVTVTPHPRELQIVRFGGPGFFKRLQVRFHLH